MSQFSTTKQKENVSPLSRGRAAFSWSEQISLLSPAIPKRPCLVNHQVCGGSKKTLRTSALENSCGRHRFFSKPMLQNQTSKGIGIVGFVKRLLEIFIIKTGFCLRYQRWNLASMGVRISEGFPSLQYFIHHLVLSVSCSTFKYKVLCNNNRTFSSLKNRDYQEELFILRCSGGLNPCHPFSAVEFWFILDLPELFSDVFGAQY